MISQFGVGAAGGDLAHVGLLAPAESAFPERVGDDGDAGARCGGPDGVGEHGGGGVGGRGWGLASGLSSRITAWKWTRPRFWYSATLAQ